MARRKRPLVELLRQQTANPLREPEPHIARGSLTGPTPRFARLLACAGLTSYVGGLVHCIHLRAPQAQKIRAF